MENNATGLKDALLKDSPKLAVKIVDLQYSRQSEFWKKYGPRGKEISIRDAGYHIPFLAEAIELEDKKIFTNYVGWVKKLFRGLNFPDEVMIVTLECTRDVINEEYPENMASLAARYIQYGIEEMKLDVADSKSYIDLSHPLGRLADDYNQALLKGDRKSAGIMVLKAVENGVSVKDLYINVFQVSQYEVGRLWLDNKISVAKEHFCSAATQQIMSQLYPYIFTTERIGKTLVAANVGRELHEIGIRMVADFFEMEGWDTYYMGANTPASSIIQAIKENDARVVGLSISMPYHISTLRDTAMRIREEFDDKVKIIIGGYALSDLGGRYRDFYADGYAPNAMKAVEMASALTE